MASKVILVSRFKLAAAHAEHETKQAVEKAIDEGEKEANKRLERGNSQRGYNLSTDVTSETIRGGMSGQIEFPHFWGRFFEYGTVYIDPIPFMRPGYRRMRKVFLSEMGDLFGGWRRL